MRCRCCLRVQLHKHVVRLRQNHDGSRSRELGALVYDVQGDQKQCAELVTMQYEKQSVENNDTPNRSTARIPHVVTVVITAWMLPGDVRCPGCPSRERRRHTIDVPPGTAQTLQGHRVSCAVAGGLR